MGTLIYNHSVRIDLDDTLLVHLKAVVFAKLRGQETFPVTITPQEKTAPTTSFWVSPSSAIVFEISTEMPLELSRELIDELMKSSYENRGLVITAS